MENEFKGRIIFSDNYRSTIQSIKQINSNYTGPASIKKGISENAMETYGSQLKIVPGYESNYIFSIDNSKGEQSNTHISAYDESILELNSLEGRVRCISHCTVIQHSEEYVPAAYVTLKFYTRSSLVQGNSTEFSDIITSNDITTEINSEYIKERKYFLSQAAPDNSLLFIDGSIFSGAATSGNFMLIEQLLKKNCRPIFFVKNSESNIITERFAFAKGYNSDLHWAYKTFRPGEMSPVFSYISPDGRGKAMTFMKIFENRSPIRVEFPLNAFLEGYYPDHIFDLIFYQYLANGSLSNVQPRIIQISELYAREILRSTNLYKEIERMGLTKSMNEERF